MRRRQSEDTGRHHRPVRGFLAAGRRRSRRDAGRRKHAALARPRARPELGIKAELFIKYEGSNPTGSFKDRGMTVAVTEALRRGAKAVICASTGNTSASAAAYAARAGLRCFVLIPKGAVAAGKLAQTMMLGLGSSR